MSASTSEASDDDYFKRSSYVENLIEVAFISDLLRHLWVSGIRDVEVLRANVDAWGYDIVLARGKIMRHIQLKSSRIDSKTKSVPVNGKLQDKTGGCVIWVKYNPTTLDLGPFLWYGAIVGETSPQIRNLQPARRTTANSKGQKPFRPDTYIITASQFKRLNCLDELVANLLPDVSRNPA